MSRGAGETSHGGGRGAGGALGRHRAHRAHRGRRGRHGGSAGVVVALVVGGRLVVALVVGGRGGVDWGHAGCRHAHRGRDDCDRAGRVVAVSFAALGGVGGVGAEDEGSEEEREGVLDVHGGDEMRS